MRPKHILSILLVGFAAMIYAPVSAQIVSSGGAGAEGGTPGELAFLTYYGEDGKGNTYGSPFMFDDWKPGYVIMANSDTLLSIKIGLDLYKGELIIAGGGMPRMELTKEMVKGFGIQDEDQILHFVPRNLAEEDRSEFLQILCISGGYEVYVLKRKYLKKGDEYGSSRLYNEFKFSKDKYFISIPGKSGVFEVPAAKKAFLKLVDDPAGACEKYIRENKLRLNQPEDLKKIAEFLAGSPDSL